MEEIEVYENIKNLTSTLIKKYKTNNPYFLAANLDIYIKETDIDPNIFKARVYFHCGNKGIIINKNLDEMTKKILVAHELGHALLHEKFLCYYGSTYSENIEREANLFALELLSRNQSNDLTQYNSQDLYNALNSILEIKDCC